MIELLATYYDQSFVDFLASLFGAVPAGVLLAVIGWLVSYLVYAAISLFKRV